MYSKRIKIFVAFIAFLLAMCLLRLIQMQLVSNSFYLEQIAELTDRQSSSHLLKTVRGKIFDRKQRILADDQPQFQLHISYELSSLLDERIERAELMEQAEQDPQINEKIRSERNERLDDLDQVIDKCTYFGPTRDEILRKITEFNDEMWRLRTFLAWLRNDPSANILKKYHDRVNSIPLSVATADFQETIPDANQRLTLINDVDDIPDMTRKCPIVELKTNDDVFTAQIEFIDAEGIEIISSAHRFYPYGPAAAQTIGWVGPANEDRLFADDKLASYMAGEVAGRRPGAEYVCESLLRGKRGELIYDIDRHLVSVTEMQLGNDVTLTIDIELQQRIENYMSDFTVNPDYCTAPMAAVVIEVATGDILALVSLPVFNLNDVRTDYGRFANDSNEPLRNRAIYKQYPPGSVIKPLILIAGLEAGEITPNEVISCPVKKAPKSWPSCWLFNRYPWLAHDLKWKNIARNAIKGSCNIYFSRLAERIEPLVLQRWFSKLGYGQKILLPPVQIRKDENNRNFMQASGIVSSGGSEGQIRPKERRWFGIGQGNLRVTPLQVANAMAAIARGGLFRFPRLFIEQSADARAQFTSVDLNISPRTMAVVHEGMSAVVNEAGGTAHETFSQSNFGDDGVKVYGKTGSTESPEHAWFAGFAEDAKSKSIAIAVLVEGGQHGSSDAAPLARDIIQFCVEAGYLGQVIETPENTFAAAEARPNTE